MIEHSPIELPAVVRNRATAVGAQWWIDGIDDLVAALADDWDFALGRSFDEGTEAFVAQVTRADGSAAVLKVLVPRAELGIDDHEALVLRSADGDGCPRLYRDDPARGALLMEFLGPSMFALGLPYERRLPLLCDAAQQIWRPMDDDVLPTGADKAAYLAEFIARTWEELDRPCSQRAIDHALACARRRERAHDPTRAVLVHGDVHQWNALRVSDEDRDEFKLIDPDGLVAEAEYDLGVILREDPVELLATGDPFATARWMADRYTLDATAIWEWGVAERVSTGLMATRLDLQPVGQQLLDAADRVS